MWRRLSPEEYGQPRHRHNLPPPRLLLNTAPATPLPYDQPPLHSTLTSEIHTRTKYGVLSHPLRCYVPPAGASAVSIPCAGTSTADDRQPAIRRRRGSKPATTAATTPLLLPSSDWADLPRSVLENVFNRLRTCDVGAVLRVCTVWDRVAHESVTELRMSAGGSGEGVAKAVRIGV
mmetsp:Transcript_16034/g.28519  ORF Transcript_16034/g.28519 Transcript_16034/m.28519 type:complete len:176 (+) Transcript_16034:106-633(+)